MPVQNSNYIPELEMFSHLFPHLFKSFNYNIIVLFRDTYKFTVAGGVRYSKSGFLDEFRTNAKRSNIHV